MHRGWKGHALSKTFPKEKYSHCDEKRKPETHASHRFDTFPRRVPAQFERQGGGSGLASGKEGEVSGFGAGLFSGPAPELETSLTRHHVKPAHHPAVGLWTPTAHAGTLSAA